MGRSENAALPGRSRVAMAQPEFEPVRYRVGNRVIVRADSQAVVKVSHTFLELGQSAGLCPFARLPRDALPASVVSGCYRCNPTLAFPVPVQSAVSFAAALGHVTSLSASDSSSLT